ncbi:lipase family protein [Nocardia sp. NPDC058058]|uniref:lipase family protein n=1 Tax=Nocardia sp. NPDC058058 TaxID=3346317 RepID=UPI0036DC8806
MRALLAVAALLAATDVMIAPAMATPNTSDSFYIPPADYEAAEPGSILRTRPIQASYNQSIPMRVDAWQLLYRTTAADGRPYAAVTTVLKSATTARPSAVLSFQNMIDAVAPHCMPSQALQQGQVPWFDASKSGPIQLTTMANDTPMVAAALSRGWAVSVPDFGGIDNNAWTPKEPGYVVLDGIRATENFDPAGLSGPDTRAVMWGYSGGAMATAWAAQEQSRYAPELNIVGSALGAPVGDERGGFDTLAATTLGGAFIPITLAAMMQDSGEFATALNRYLTPYGQQRIADARENCAPQNMVSGLDFDIGRSFTVPLRQVLADPVIGAEVDARSLGSSAPATPVYVYNAVNDEGSTIGAIDALVSGYCDRGTPVTYRREAVPLPLSGHALEWFLGAPGALAWLQRAVDGSITRSGCDIQTVPATVLEPEALQALASGIVVGSARQLLGY